MHAVWSAFEHLEIARLRFVWRVVDDLSLPGFTGSVFRGAFGHALRASACVTGAPDCQECPLETTCLYPYFFETSGTAASVRPPADSGEADFPHASAPTRDVSRPFVLRPPMDGRTRYRSGDPLVTEMVLLGQGVRHAPEVISASRRMGAQGIGPQQARLGLERVEAIVPGQRPVLLSAAGLSVRTPAPAWRLTAAAIAERANGRSTQCLTVKFLTPTRLKTMGRLTESPAFHVLARRLLERLTTVAREHGGCEPPPELDALWDAAPSVSVVDSRLTWWEFDRYSRRQNQPMTLGGITGAVTFEGDLGPFLPLLKIGEHLHVGKGTTFGFGQFRLMEGGLDDPDRSGTTVSS